MHRLLPTLRITLLALFCLFLLALLLLETDAAVFFPILPRRSCCAWARARYALRARACFAPPSAQAR